MNKKLKDMVHFSRVINEITTISFGKRINFKLACPLTILIHSEENFIFAENKELAVVGLGKSEHLAVKELLKHIIHFYYYFKKLPNNKITGDAVRLKRIYETLLIKMEAAAFVKKGQELR